MVTVSRSQYVTVQHNGEEELLGAPDEDPPPKRLSRVLRNIFLGTKRDASFFVIPWNLAATMAFRASPASHISLDEKGTVRNALNSYVENLAWHRIVI